MENLRRSAEVGVVRGEARGVLKGKINGIANLGLGQRWNGSMVFSIVGRE